jgi:hypothetical protein
MEGDTTQASNTRRREWTVEWAVRDETGDPLGIRIQDSCRSKKSSSQNRECRFACGKDRGAFCFPSLKEGERPGKNCRTREIAENLLKATIISRQSYCGAEITGLIRRFTACASLAEE